MPIYTKTHGAGWYRSAHLKVFNYITRSHTFPTILEVGSKRHHPIISFQIQLTIPSNYAIRGVYIHHGPESMWLRTSPERALLQPVSSLSPISIDILTVTQRADPDRGLGNYCYCSGDGMKFIYCLTSCAVTDLTPAGRCYFASSNDCDPPTSDTFPCP
jgi:hypothetical protein